MKKYSHTMRQMIDMQMNKRKVIDDRVRDKQGIHISANL